LSISVVVLNNGTVSETALVVNATYDGTLIGKQTVTSLAAGNSQTLSFSWNTTGLPAGSYTVTATVTPVAGQTDLSNISRSKTVQVQAQPVVLYSVNFTESGLAQGSQWSVTFNAQTNSSTLSSIVFNSLNGAYPYSVNGSTGFTASPANGIVTVNGQNATVDITFLATPTSTRHDLAVIDVTASPNPANQGNVVSISVLVLNNGTVPETSFDVNVTCDGTLIGKQTVASLAPGSSQILSFSWDTSGIAAAYYTIKAAAAQVAGETDLSNNVMATTVQIEALTSTRQYVSTSVPVFLAFLIGLGVAGGSVLMLFLVMFRKKKRKKPARRYTVKVVRQT
jgi:hypothetical protein